MTDTSEETVTFRDAVAMQLEATTGLHRGACDIEADEMLDMPEMEAIANLIACETWMRAQVRKGCAVPDNRADPLVFTGYNGTAMTIPRHVVEWALDVVQATDEQP